LRPSIHPAKTAGAGPAVASGVPGATVQALESVYVPAPPAPVPSATMSEPGRTPLPAIVVPSERAPEATLSTTSVVDSAPPSVPATKEVGATVRRVPNGTEQGALSA